MSEQRIYIVSGGAGLSGEQTVQTALAQFGEGAARVIIVPHVRGRAQIEDVINEAQREGGIIVHTLVDAELRGQMVELARAHSVTAVDLMGNLLSRLSDLLGRAPAGQPGLYRQLRQNYFERIEAIEYTVAHDDGRRPHELDQAEIILTGVSRVGKTPLAMYLSVQGWKTANVPLVPGIDPPDELFRVNPRKVIGLTIDMAQILTHRRWRQRRLGLAEEADYVDPAAVQEQLTLARRVFQRGGFTVIDITNRPIEESATEVIELVTRHLKRPGSR
jgi:regulator of PEP synthase PpsR (kinase-PPPase family)